MNEWPVNELMDSPINELTCVWHAACCLKKLNNDFISSWSQELCSLGHPYTMLSLITAVLSQQQWFRDSLRVFQFITHPAVLCGGTRSKWLCMFNHNKQYNESHKWYRNQCLMQGLKAPHWNVRVAGSNAEWNIKSFELLAWTFLHYLILLSLMNAIKKDSNEKKPHKTVLLKAIKVTTFLVFNQFCVDSMYNNISATAIIHFNITIFWPLALCFFFFFPTSCSLTKTSILNLLLFWLSLA